MGPVNLKPDYFERNLQMLRKSDPGLSNRVDRIPFPGKFSVQISRDGVPVPRLNGTALHSTYHPLQEARNLVNDLELNPNFKLVVYGLGFGYHVVEILKRHSGNIWVVEPSLEMFRAFLSAIDLSPFLPRVKFLVAESPAKILARNLPDEWKAVIHRPTHRLEQKYFDGLEEGRRVKQFLSENSLRILVVDPIYGGSLPTAKYCAETFRELGHEVASVECERYSDTFFALKDVTRIRENSEVLSGLFMNLMGQVIAAKAAEFKPDLILALAQAPMTPETIQNLKRLGIPVSFWFVEDFRTLSYWKDIAGDYDYFFSIQEDGFFDELRDLGIENYYYLPQACAPSIHRPVDLTNDDRKTYSADLSFMGAAYHNRIQSFPRLLDFDFKIWGTGWCLDSRVGRRVQNENQRVSSSEIVKIYNAARINLNLHSSTCHNEINPEGDFVNPRTFEIASCGGFQLVDERLKLSDLFDAGEEIVTFNSIDDLRKKIKWYLEHDEERRAIAARSRAKVLAQHTLGHRMTELMIHVFTHRFEGLQTRVTERKDPVGMCIEKAGRNTDLGRYLERFRGRPDFSFHTLIKDIEEGEGDLNNNEALLLMINQIVREEESHG